MIERGEGVWVPKDVLTMWESLRLNTPAWNVLIVMAHQQYRYGGTEARITLLSVAQRTGHSLSTVKRAVRRLRDEKLLMKLRRGKSLSE